MFFLIPQSKLKPVFFHLVQDDIQETDYSGNEIPDFLLLFALLLCLLDLKYQRRSTI